MRSRDWGGLWLGLLVLSLPVLAWPQGERRLKQELSVDVTRRPLDQVLVAIGKRAGRNVIVQPGLTDPITIKLRDVSWRVAIDVIARRAKCRVRVLAGGTLLIDRPRRVSIQLSDADLKTALLLLARYAGKSIVLGPQVRGRVTTQLRSGDVVKAMQAIAKTHGFLILTRGGLITVGKTAAGLRAAKAPAAPTDTLSGTFVSLAKDVLTIDVDGAQVALDLSRDAAKRALQTRSLKGAARGMKLVVTFAAPDPKGAGAGAATRRVVTNLVAETR